MTLNFLTTSCEQNKLQTHLTHKGLMVNIVACWHIYYPWSNISIHWVVSLVSVAVGHILDSVIFTIKNGCNLFRSLVLCILAHLDDRDTWCNRASVNEFCSAFLPWQVKMICNETVPFPKVQYCCDVTAASFLLVKHHSEPTSVKNSNRTKWQVWIGLHCTGLHRIYCHKLTCIEKAFCTAVRPDQAFWWGRW